MDTESQPNQPTQPSQAPVPSHTNLDTYGRRITGMNRRQKAFADRYLVNGMNAADAYRQTFRPKNADIAYTAAYRVMALPAVKTYIDDELSRVNNVEYSQDAIKQGIHRLAVNGKMEAVRLRALELMSKITGLLNEQSPAQVNVFTADIIELAKKRLSERKNTINTQIVTDPESPQVIEAQGDTVPMSHNNNYVSTEPESVLSTNTGTDTGGVSSEDTQLGTVGLEDSPPSGRGREAPPTVKGICNPSP